MTLKSLLGRDIIHELNIVKKLFSPEYEKYWYTYITPLIKQRKIQLGNEIDDLERCSNYLEYNMLSPMKDYRLNSLLDKLGYKRGY